MISVRSEVQILPGPPLQTTEVRDQRSRRPPRDAGSPIRTHRVPPCSGRSMRTGPGHTSAPAPLQMMQRSRRSDVHEVLTFRPDPSGPNSAPRCFARGPPRSTHVLKFSTVQYWLRLSRSTPNGQCSTFRSTVAPSHSLGKRRWALIRGRVPNAP